MYCKHCGKQIDDDSTFCKYCGKSLSGVTNLPSSLIGFFKQRTVFVALLVIWILLASVISAHCSSGNYNHSIPFIASFSSLLATLVLFSLIYWSYKNLCKFHITLINKSDSVKVKLAKYTYLTYTYCVPFYAVVYNASDFIEGIVVYYIILAYIWLIPTLVICSIYYIYKLKKNH